MRSNPIIAKTINKYIRNGRNCLVLVSGETGTGKSYASLSIAKRIDPTFSIDRVIFNQLDFMKLLNQKDEKGKFILKKGMAVMYEEAGTSVDARSWWLNKDFSHIIETFRNRQLIVFLTLPNANMLDKNIRSLCNISIQTMKINRKDKVCYVRPMIITLNTRMNSSKLFYMKYPREGRYIVKLMAISIPPKDLAKAYEKMANIWKHELLEEKQRNKENAIVKERDKKNKKEFDYDKAIETVINNIEDFKSDKGKIRSEIISEKLGITQRKAIIISNMVKKSYVQDSNLVVYNKSENKDKKKARY